MELQEIGEFGLIARIKSHLPAPPPFVRKGIGDDAAISSLSTGADLVSTVDLLVEGVHFDLSLTSAYLLGRKSLAVNLSDIAAMGAKPLFALISLAIPARTKVEFIDEFFEGFLAMAEAHGVSLIGGDTSSSPAKFFISVTLLGEGKKEMLLYRDGALPGDDLYVTGTLGDSTLGLRLAQNRRGERASPAEAFLWERHFNPVPRVKEGRALAERGLVRAMIDVSDGLFSDLQHICEESRVGATVWADRIPQSAPLRLLAPAPAWQSALRGGEDYELLFAAAPEKALEIMALSREWECGVACIGKAEPPGHGIVIRDERGPVDPELLKGYDHFAAQAPL
ncbi:MAG: thiamine-phosphate kinase [Deltaproteobacteria bacterium RBG_19FT_COMBO_52_11]|nr:MAG: thiamine-phosphate kinase [Deltaproteobacteria bacterium RBG_19FT_COMBO_52_11]